MLNSTIDLPDLTPAALDQAVALALGRALGTTTSRFPSTRPPELFTRALRDSVYSKLGLSLSQIEAIEEIISESPARKPGKGAIDNLISLVQSQKNGGPRWLESHTVERLFFYQLERDPDVLGFVTQARCRGVRKLVSKGVHVSSPTLDFLVFYRDRIVLVECKAEDALEKLAQRKSEWINANGRWTNTVLEEHANRLGIELSVFSVGRLFSIELQNAEFINAVLRTHETETERKTRAQASSALAERPLSVEQLSDRIPGFTLAIAARMLIKLDAFGLERVVSMADSDKFLLFASSYHRDVIDDELWREQFGETEELRITDRLLLASPARVAIAKLRWERLQAIAAGSAPRTRRMSAVGRLVQARIEQGCSPLEACLTEHDKSGNRQSRLVDRQVKAIKSVAERWVAGEFPDREEAWFELERICKSKEVNTPHQSTLNRALRKENGARRTLIVEGLREYQKEKSRTDGSRCSLPSIVYGHTLVVDSSNFDQRTAYNLITSFPSSVPRFYAAVDAASGHPMAHALMFGPARTDGLAILLREFVSRHGFLPRCIQLDRGPENTGGWIKDFAEHFGIELRWPPAGGSRWNGLAENVIGRVNHTVAHKAPGSTKPDQFGRATDGRLKSRKTASKTFEHIVRSFESFYYGELPHLRDAENLSPADRKEHLLAIEGHGGIPCEFDDAFRVLTSIPIDVPKNVRASRGIRLVEGTFAGAALNTALRHGHITELRKDCIDPAVVYAKAGGKWYRAFRRDCVPRLIRSGEEKLFRLLCEPGWRSERAIHNLDQKRAISSRRHAEMSEAMLGKQHLLDSHQADESAEGPSLQVTYPKVDWESLVSRRLQ